MVIKHTKVLTISIVFLVVFIICIGVFLFGFYNFKNTEKSYSVSIVGSKASSLFHLQKIKGIVVPPWFVLDTITFSSFLKQHNEIILMIKKLDEISKKIIVSNDASRVQQLEKSAFSISRDIRDAILKATLPRELLVEIHQKYKELIKKCGYKSFFVVRSSGVAEDLPGSSFAGVYDTFLNQRGENDIIYSIKQCWASVFNDRAIVERNRNNISHSDASTAVIVQQMVDAKAAGTAFTMEISTGYPGIEIAANYGLGEGVVGGEVSVDKWLIHPNTLRVIKSIRGSKKIKFLPNTIHSGISAIPCSISEQNNYVLDNKTIINIASKVKKIGEYYFANFSYPYIDTEFVIDKKGEVFFVQARPIVKVSQTNLLVVDKEEAKNHKIIAHGRHSVPGATYGKIKIIPSWQDLSSGKISIEPDDIVVTCLSSNYWTQYMTKFKGIITQEGGPTSHPILLSRERGVPCVVGFSTEDFANFYHYAGQYVTLDGTNRVVYEGKVDLKQASSDDFSKQFEMVRVEKYPSFEELSKRLTLSNRVFITENGTTKEFWLKSPIYTLDPLSLEIHRKGYNLRAKIVGVKNWPTEIRVINGFLCEKLTSDEQKVRSYFSHMDLEKSEEFLRIQEKSIANYLAMTTPNFKLNGLSWDKYVKLAAEMRAYRLLGFCFRTYVNERLAQEAVRLKIPKYYLELYQSLLQLGMREEDSVMLQTIDDLARRFQFLLSKNPQILLSELKSKYGNLYSILESSAKQFRFQEDQSFKSDLDLEIFLQRILKESRKLKNSNIKKSTSTAKKIKEDYFPQDDVLRRWAILSVRARVVHSNVHHYESRGLWNVQKSLLHLGKYLVNKGILKNPKLIFDFSIQEIKNNLALKSF